MVLVAAVTAPGVVELTSMPLLPAPVIWLLVHLMLWAVSRMAIPLKFGFVIVLRATVSWCESPAMKIDEFPFVGSAVGLLIVLRTIRELLTVVKKAISLPSSPEKRLPTMAM